MFDSYRNKKDLPITQEESKYKSKKESSVSHSSSKSKHKHEYKPCKLRYSDTYTIPGKDAKTYTFIDSADYCIICGKINNRKMIWRNKEVIEDPNIPTFDVGGYRDKFVDIS